MMNQRPENGETYEELQTKEESIKFSNNSDIKETLDTASSKVKLKKELGVLEGVGVIFGTVVGSGIFVSPKGVVENSGSIGLALIVWVAGGIFSMVGAFCFAELGTMIPKSGGMYTYLDCSFGPIMSFLYIWVTTLTRNAASTAAIALTFGQYMVHLVMPSCNYLYPQLPVLFALLLTCFLTYINCKRVHWVTRLQNLFTFTKMSALIIIIVIGLVQIFMGRTQNLETPFANTKWEVASLSSSFYHCIFSYIGWDYLNLVTEEMKNPNKNLPLAIIISTSLITLLYTLTNLSYFTVLTTSEIIASEAVVMTLASRVLGIFAWTMPLFIALSTFGSVNSCLFTQTRLTFVGARKGHCPNTFNLVSINSHSPVPAVILNGFTIIVMVLVPDISLLINYTAFSASAMQLAVICSLFWFRIKHPEWQRPFKVWLIVPVIFFASVVFLVVVPMIMTPYDVLGAVLITIAGFPIYYLTIYRTDIAKYFSGCIEKVTISCQKLFLCMPEEKDE